LVFPYNNHVVANLVDPFVAARNHRRTGKVVTQIVTQLFATWWQIGGIATFIVATKKEPQAGYALGVLVDQAAGAGGLGVPPDPVRLN
jgi:hypothetical protein